MAKTKKPGKAKSKPAAKKATRPKAANKAAAKSAKPAAKGTAKSAAKAGKPAKASGEGTAAKPWNLTTPPGSSAFTVYRDEAADPPALVCKVGTTELRYHLRCIEDLHAMLKQHGDWMLLGGTDEQKPAPADTVEAWGRDAKNPVGGWYGLKKNLRGRFAVYLPPVLEVLGLAEVEHEARNNRMRAR